MCEAVYVLKMILSQLHIVLSLPLWEGCTRIFSQWCIPLCPPTVSPYRSSAKRVYNTQCLSVLVVFSHVWVVTRATSLSLAAEEVFQRVLANVHAQKSQFAESTEALQDQQMYK